jgi:serralysin
MMSDTNDPAPCSHCATDFLLPESWFKSTDEAAERAAQALGYPVPISRSRAAAVFAGTKFMQPSGFEQTWREDLLWTKKTIAVAFQQDAGGMAQKALDIAKEWCKYANLDFVPANDFASGDIRVTFQGAGFQSVLGRQAVTQVPRNQPSMTLGFISTPQSPDHVRRLVLHEFGHAIGLEHEHAHRKAGIKWNETELVKYLRKGLPAHLSDAQIVAQVKLFNAPGAQWGEADYDLLSIMRYRFPKEVFLTGWDSAFNVENTTLSEGDKKAAIEMYPGRDPIPIVGIDPKIEEKSIKAGDTVSGSIKEGQTHRYNFDADGTYEITTEGKAIVRIELLTKDGERPSTVTRNVDDANSATVGAFLLGFLPEGSYYVTVRSSPLRPGPLSEGDYRLKLVKKS